MSFQSRFFYEDGAVTAPDAPPNIAALMASQGVKIDADSSEAAPNITIAEEKPITPVVAPPVAADTTKPSSETEPIPVAPAKPEPTPAPSPAAPPAQAGAVDWKEELKKADQAAILKELGFDDKMVGFFNKWRTDGNIADYIRAVTVDYSKMSAEQLMRHQLEVSNPELSPEDLEELYQARVVDQYKLNPDAYSETEVARGRLLLKVDAKAVREGLIKQQQEYILSAKPPAPVVDNTAQIREAEMNELRTRYTASLTSSQLSKDLLANKTLALGTGEYAMKYEVHDPEQVLNILQNPELYAQQVFLPDGSPVVEKQLFIAAAAIDHVGLQNEIFKAGMSAGAKKAIEQIENAKKPEGELSKNDPSASDPIAALARSGVITYG